jgi:lipid II:glycine glycyltransferase (peptidoglycan interpeptide bridge formation enzyme)
LTSPTQWTEFITANQGHLLQSWAWGELKSQFGWTPVRVQVGRAGAQILFRRLTLGWTIAYVPKGPVVNWSDGEQGQALFEAIHREAKKHRSLFLKIEPDLSHLDGADGQVFAPAQTFLRQAGFRPSDPIQPPTTLIIDLDPAEKAILAAMKQKTRYNIRLAGKKGVIVRQGSRPEVSLFHQLALTTADRNEFGVHSLDYYQLAFDLFAPDRCALFIAEFEGQPVAAVMVFRQGEEAYYFYGASSNQHRNLMPTYLVQWEAIRWAKAQGCFRYDLWGVPDADTTTLEAQFQDRHDGLWGVYRFKRGFGAQVIRSIGAFDYVYNPVLYPLYKLRRKF